MNFSVSHVYSSVSSALNAVATVTWEDMAKPFFSDLSEAGKAKVTRMMGMSTRCQHVYFLLLFLTF